MGRKIIVIVGTNWNIGINAKKTATSTNPRIPIDKVAVIGNSSCGIFSERRVVALDVRLIKPPDVPRVKIWYSKIPVIR